MMRKMRFKSFRIFLKKKKFVKDVFRLKLIKIIGYTKYDLDGTRVIKHFINFLLYRRLGVIATYLFKNISNLIVDRDCLLVFLNGKIQKHFNVCMKSRDVLKIQLLVGSFDVFFLKKIFKRLFKQRLNFFLIKFFILKILIIIFFTRLNFFTFDYSFFFKCLKIRWFFLNAIFLYKFLRLVGFKYLVGLNYKLMDFVVFFEIFSINFLDKKRKIFLLNQKFLRRLMFGYYFNKMI